MNTCLNRELTRIKGLHGFRNNDWCSLQPVCRSNASGTWRLFDSVMLCTLRSAGARELDVSPFYRHIAPLEQKHICRPAGAMLVQRFIELMNTCLNRELTRIKGLHGFRNNDWCSLQPVCRSNASGTWGLFDLLLPCTLRSAGARELDVSPFYRHIAPLEQKHICRPAGAMLVQRFIELMNTCLNRGLTRIKGLHGFRNNDWCSLQPVCRSNASGTWGLFDLLLPCTLRSAGARELDVSPFYRHIAPLEQKHICRPAGAMLVQRFIELMNTCLNRELTRIKGLHGFRNNDWCSLQPVCRSNASGT